MAEVTYRGVTVETRPDVYDPSHDTFLLADHASFGRRRVLEIGSGSGLVGLIAGRSGARVVAADVNPHAVRLTRDNARRNGVDLDVVMADLFRGLRAEAFDAVIVNPPYLPTSESDRVAGPLHAAFDAGPDGLDFIRRFALFLAEARPRLRPGFEARMLVSSLQNESKVVGLLGEAGFTTTRMAALAMGLETLYVMRVQPASATP